MGPPAGAEPPVGRAPGRLDLLGGVADYSGALVLEVPTRARTTVTAHPTPADLVVGPVTLSAAEVRHLAAAPYEEVRGRLAAAPRWTRYPIGVVVVLVRHGVIDPPSAALEVTSDVPMSLGVSSSAALEVATARALGAGTLDRLRLAALCQEAENQVVGAPCGIMDQVAVAVGTPGAVLPVLCRPASVEPSVPLPQGVEVVGWPSGAAHDVAGGPYARARTAAFMGKRIVEATAGRRWPWVSAVPAALVATLPEVVDGGTFIERWGDIDDTLSLVDERGEYPVRAATGFGVDEHRRTTAALAHLRSGAVTELGPLLAASHAGYSAMGLGHPATDEIATHARSRPGVHGARVSGGGSGGTVVAVCDRGALDGVAGLIR